jgi:uncharacterized protein (TIGR02147 family)
MNLSDTNHIIYKAKSSSEALRGLYEFEKTTNKNRSLAYFCKRAKIPSTGYFSDVLTGKRTLNPKYRISITRAFDLNDAAATCLRLLIDIDNETALERKMTLHSKLTASKKLLKVAYLPLRSDTQELFVALDVFCAFGLFGNRPTIADLEKYFNSSSEPFILKSLQLLESLGLVKLEGEHYAVLLDHVLFGTENGSISPLDFLKMSIAHAAENVAAWFGQKNHAYFTSTVASVKRETYETALQEFKTTMLQAQSSMASDEADMLVRFNIQIYPITQPLRG